MSGMTAYFIRRLMLVPITFFAITFMVYTILRVVPGGPIEQAETAMKMAAMRGEGGGGSSGGAVSEGDLQLDAKGLEELEEYYALDRPILVGYLQWLGLWQRSFKTRVPAATMEKHGEAFKPLKDLFAKQGERETELDELLAPKGHVVFRGRLYRTLSDEELEKLMADEKSFYRRAEALRGGGYGKLDELLAFLEIEGHTYADGKYCAVLSEIELAEDREYAEKALNLIAAIRAAGEKREQIAAERGFEINEVGLIYKVEKRLSGIVQLDFGRSYTHNEPVLGLIGSKMEISIQFGLIGYLLTWVVCVPLGVYKAIKHHSFFDTASSFVVFLGYSMPGFVVCMLLLVGVAVNVDWLPLGGYKPDNIEQLTYLQALLGRIRHMLIPITGYMIGSFATKARQAVDQLRAAGQAVGLVRPRLLRPFPAEQLRRVLSGKQGVAVIDQNISMGMGGVLHAELAAALYGKPQAPPILASFIGGLGGRDISPQEFFEIAAITRKAVEDGVTPPARLLYTREEFREVRKLQAIAHQERNELGPEA